LLIRSNTVRQQTKRVGKGKKKSTKGKEKENGFINV